ncbi:MAG TPA: aldehyde ferredoxin oxidoreductase N-terminal domain-containing protein, partial [Atribacterota bacterium]|nr:aldehyde ferredoxin oxidoreductase N-terminal domain-containing protein [Atribacterota bacterium]
MEYRPIIRKKSSDFSYRSLDRYFCSFLWQSYYDLQVSFDWNNLYLQFRGAFGARFKFTGYDAIVIKGRSAKPVYVYINDKEIKIEDATLLWCKSTVDTTENLKTQYAKTASVLSIGPAGENGVLYASVVADGARGFGRGGLGAIWGSKNLKALVADGKSKPRIKEPNKLKNVVYEAQKAIKQNPFTSQALPELGSSFIIDVLNFEQALPFKNFSARQFSENL